MKRSKISQSGNRRPCIGVTGARNRGWFMWAFTALSLWWHGASPRRLTPPLADNAIDGLDGLVIGGGDHISATLYGGEPIPEMEPDPDRDRLELDALARLWPTGLPILGICRGAQLMNVYRGGRLHQDVWAIYTEQRRRRTPLPVKHVTVDARTRLARHIGRERFSVNSLHDQAIDTLGESMHVAARDSDGMIQALEACSDAFRIGVQWHPEFLIYKRPHRLLFRAFMNAARDHRDAVRAAQTQVAAA